MALYLEYSGAVGEINKIQKAIDEMVRAGGEINKCIGSLENFWKGDAYNARREEYYGTFKPTIDRVNSSAAEYKKMMDDCIKQLAELDRQMAGKG